jgi:hypothetical protein
MNIRRSIAVCTLSLTLLLLAAQNAGAQIVKKPSSQSKKPAPNTSPSETKPTPIASFEGKLVSVFDPENPDGGDYVPCQFTAQQLLMLRPKPEITVISSYDEEQIKSAVLEAALSNANAGVFNDSQKTAFAKALAEVSLEGLTMSQALTVVIDIVSKTVAPSNEAQKAADAATSGTGFDAFLKDQLPSKLYEYVSPGITASSPAGRLDQSRSLVANATQPNQKSGSNQAPALSSPEQSQAKKFEQVVAAGLQASNDSSSKAKNAIVDSARSVIAAFQRPNDVGCAMSILSWNSVRYAFGQTLADEYIAMQIVVRNMNSQQEFLVHDAEFAVDAELTGAHGRYFSGLDKLTVRQFMLSSRDYGRRNFIVNMAQGVGAILSAATPVWGGGLASASSVYNAGFLNALNGTWKDHNTEQLNLLNDVGFSASKTDRTVVPKSGTAMFVIFIPSKQFQTGWWTQECANVIITSKESVERNSRTKKNQKSETTDTEQSSTPANVEPQDAYKKLLKYQSERTGIDLEAARAICQQYYSPGARSTSNASNSEDFTDPKLAQDQDNVPPPGTTSNASVTEKATKVSYIRAPKSVPYKKWSDSSYAIFRELAFTVVAGSHVQEILDTTPSLSKITCPVDAKGDLDFSKITNGAISCDLTGQNLDKIAKLKLRNSQDESDKQTADGSVTTSGDSKSAKASFPLDQIGPLNQKAYKVFGVTKDGAENGGTQILHFNLEPILSAAPVPSEISLDKLTAKGAASVSVKLSGYHLDKLNDIHLDKSDKELSAADILIDAKAKAGSSTTSTIEITPAEAAKLPPGDYSSEKLKMYILLISTDDPNTKAYSGQILNGSGKVIGPSSSPQLTLSLPSSVTSGTPAAVKITIKDDTGKINASFTGTVQVTSTDKNAVLPADYTFKAADKGAHTLSVTFKTKGTQSVKVTSDAVTASKSTIVK